MHQPTEDTCARADLDTLEADVRRLMAQHAGIADRGWSTQQERHDIHTRIDSRLDSWNALRALADDLDAL